MIEERARVPAPRAAPRGSRPSRLREQRPEPCRAVDAAGKAATHPDDCDRLVGELRRRRHPDRGGATGPLVPSSSRNSAIERIVGLSKASVAESSARGLRPTRASSALRPGARSIRDRRAPGRDRVGASNAGRGRATRARRHVPPRGGGAALAVSPRARVAPRARSHPSVRTAARIKPLAGRARRVPRHRRPDRRLARGAEAGVAGAPRACSLGRARGQSLFEPKTAAAARAVCAATGRWERTRRPLRAEAIRSRRSYPGEKSAPAEGEQAAPPLRLERRSASPSTRTWARFCLIDWTSTGVGSPRGRCRACAPSRSACTTSAKRTGARRFRAQYAASSCAPSSRREVTVEKNGTAPSRGAPKPERPAQVALERVHLRASARRSRR